MNLDTACWYWAQTQTDRGYGVLYDGEKNRRAHRVVYEALIGEIPEGLVLDHLCRNRLCVNPEHLEPVTQTVNIQRGDRHAYGKPMRDRTHCKSGHPFTGKMRRGGGKIYRVCVACKQAQNKRRSLIRSTERAKRREELGLPPHHLALSGTEAVIR